MVLHIDDSAHTKGAKSFSLFALGFRPFFFLASISALTLILAWIFVLSGKITLSTYYSTTGWHAHEMLFAYTSAVIAGFLLTAVGNWTGAKMITGWRLMLLAVVFIIARFMPFILNIPHWLIAASDLIFLPLVALIIAVPIIKAKQWSNIIFVPLLLIMATANLFVHLSALGLLDISIVTGSRVMLYLVVFLITVMGGRVIPFFTERGVGGITTKKWKWVELLSPMSIILLLVFDVFFKGLELTGYVALFAATINTLRLYGWYSNKIWRVPLVWILHVAYTWFIIGFMIKALTLINLQYSVFSYHALTIGGIGVMTLGMMARVSLGHTGRDMILGKMMLFSFILINIAAIVRVIIPMLIPDYYLQLIQISGWLWAAAFSVFIILYTPMWLYPRVDGREG